MLTHRVHRTPDSLPAPAPDWLLVDLPFGESTTDSGRFRVLVDGVAVTGKGGQEKGADCFEGNRWKTGNGCLLWEVARG